MPIDDDKLRSALNAAILVRAEVAHLDYETQELKSHAASYPFARKDNGPTVLTVSSTSKGALVTVTGAAVTYREKGNAGAGLIIKPKKDPKLLIKLSPAGQSQFGGTVLALESVNAYQPDLDKTWLAAVRRAFAF